MNFTSSYQDLPLNIKIVNHINYRDIFNTSVHIDNLKKELCINNKNIKDFENSLYELQKNKFIDVKDRYLFVYGKSYLAKDTLKKKALTKKLSTETSFLSKFLRSYLLLN